MKLYSPKAQKLLLSLPKNFMILDLFLALAKEFKYEISKEELKSFRKIADLKESGAKLVKECDGPVVTLEILTDFVRKIEPIANFLNSHFGVPDNLNIRNTPFLDIFGEDITALAKKGKLDPVIGRRSELDTMIRVLLRRKKNNVVILGKAGVGKTSLVELLAQKIISEDVPYRLLNKRIITLSITNLTSEQRMRGDLELRLQKVINELLDNNVILFIDEIHQLLSGHTGEIAQALKPYLTSGRFICIGATTRNEYAENFVKDEAFRRRFQVLDLNETSYEETHKILETLSEVYSQHHHVKVPKHLLNHMISLCERYVKGVFPDKAIDLLDELCSLVAIKHQRKPDKSLFDYLKERKFYEYVKASRNPMKVKAVEATEKDLFDVVKTIAKLDDVSLVDHNTLYNKMKINVFGQDEALTHVSSHLATQNNLYRTSGCASAFIFAGPDNCGKRYAARSLARILFGDEKDHFLYFNMESFSERHQITRLIGAPPGYIGWGTGGLLTSFIRDNPSCVIYLENIHLGIDGVKAIFKEMIQEGQIQDSNGQSIDCRNCIVIGSHPDMKTKTLGFNPIDTKNMEADPDIQFFGKIIAFNKLDKEVLKKICRKMVTEFISNLKNKSVKIMVQPAIIRFVAEEAKSPRDIEFMVNSQIIDRIKYGESKIRFVLKNKKIEKCVEE